ncbi:MAG: winged helix-turn-helix domain-containing protein, partial [Xanthomonadales bacterium]|nr:winged helix-turn-helix domain-containing protein [Xanthomonadales bacterium]
EAWQLLQSGQVVHLEPTVLKLLIFLIENHDRLVAKTELLDTVWGETVVSESALSKAIARLRKALGDDPSQPRYIETVHSLGYRFVAKVREIEPSAENRPARVQARKANYAALVFAGLLVMAIISFSLDLFDLKTRILGTQEAPPIKSLAVLPLDNLAGDPEQDYFVEGLHDMLITELSKISGLKVISRQSTMRYKASNKPVAEIASELNVDALVEGGALLLGEQVKITAQLIHGQTDEHLWAETYDRDLRDVLALLGEIARTISDEIKISLLPQDEERLTSAGPVDPAANEAYLRGQYFFNRYNVEDFQKSLGYFEQAIDIDPDFALGWSGIAGAHLLIAYFGNEPPGEAIVLARVAALKALELDDQHFAGHAALGWVRLFSRDWPGAGQSFEEALRLNPNHAMTIHGYADYLMLTGRLEESLVQVRRARDIDPLTPASNLPVPNHLYMMRRYDESIMEAQELLKKNPDYPVSWLLAMVYWQKGMLQESLAEYRKTLTRANDTGLLEALARGNSESGPRGAMRAMADEMAKRSKASYVDPFKVSSAYAQTGEVSLALEWLEKAVERGSPELLYVGLRPDFDVLRGDPRYESLMQRFGLPNP